MKITDIINSMIAKKIRHIGLNIAALLCATSFFSMLEAKNIYLQENNDFILNNDILGDWNIRLIDVKGMLIYPPTKSGDSMIQINNNQIIGIAGCNNFMLGYMQQGLRQISISRGTSTKKMCTPEAMNFEDMFLQNFTGLFSIESSYNGICLVKDGIKIYLVR